MEWFKKVFGEEWEITPAGGLTGEAYFRQKRFEATFS